MKNLYILLIAITLTTGCATDPLDEQVVEDCWLSCKYSDYTDLSNEPSAIDKNNADNRRKRLNNKGLSWGPEPFSKTIRKPGSN